MRARRFESSSFGSVRGRRAAVVRAATVAACAVACVTRIAGAADGTWNGGGTDTLWQNGANWDGGTVPGSTSGTSSADLVLVSPTMTQNVITVDANRNVAGFRFDTNTQLNPLLVGATPNAGNAIYLSGGGLTQIDGPAPVALQENDLNAPMILAGSTYAFSNFAGDLTSTFGGLRLFGDISAGTNASTVITFDGDHGSSSTCRAEIYSTISDGLGTVGVIKNGPGCWEMNTDGSTPNTYSGDTIVNGGLLRTSTGAGKNGLGGYSVNSHYIVNNGATFRSGVVGNTIKKLTVNVGGIVTASQAAITVLNIKSESGPAINLNLDAPVNSNPINFSLPFGLIGTTPDHGGVTLLAAPGATGTGAVTFGNSSSPFSMGTVRRIFDIGKGADANTDYDLRVQGPISGSGGFIKRGAGTLRFSGTAAATLTGNIDIQAGIFNPSASNLFASTSPTLQLSGGNLRLQSDQTQTFGQVSVTAGNVTTGNDNSALLAPGYAFDIADGATSTIAARLGESAGPAQAVKNGLGRVVLGGDVNVFSSGLTINAGLVQLAADAVDPATRVIRTGPLTIATAARLDLRDNKLVTTSPAGTFTAGAYTGVAGLVDSARGPAGNALWDGATGITTSDTRAINNGDLLSIGVATAAEARNIAATDTTTFAGQTVLGSDTIAMVTWGGDATLDGKINIDDYGQIDSNVSKSGTVFGWNKGDFNYDGKINIDDYGIIDGNIGRQGTAFATGIGSSSSSVDGVAAVPEPAGFAVLAIAALSLKRRRRNI